MGCVCCLLSTFAIGQDVTPHGEGPGAVGRRFVVREIILPGVRATDLAYVRQLMQLRPGKPFNEDILNEDLHRIDEKGRYEYIGTTERDPVGGRVVIHLRERPPIVNVRYRVRRYGRAKFTDSPSIPEVDFEPSLKTRAEDQIRYHRQRAEMDADLIRRAYIAAGYYETQVRHEAHRTLGGVDVTFYIDEGPLVRVRCIVFAGVGGDLPQAAARLRQEHPGWSEARSQNAARRDAIDREVAMRTKMHTQLLWTFFGKEVRKVLDADAFEQDLKIIKDLYHKDGYLDVVVEPGKPHVTATSGGSQLLDIGHGSVVPVKKIEPDPRGNPYVRLLTHATGRKYAGVFIKITEGRVYTIGKISVEGNRRLPADEILDAIDLQTDDVFSYALMGQVRERVQLLYGSQGYITTRVPPPRRILTDQPYVLDVKIIVQEADRVRVRRIEVEGNTKTKDHVILREVEQDVGEYVDLKRVEQSKRNLRNTLFFEQTPLGVDHMFRPVPEDPEQVDLVFRVREAPTGQFMLGFGFSSNDNFFGQVNLNQQNFDLTGVPTDDYGWSGAFMGGGQRLSLNANLGTNRSNYQISFSDPMINDFPLRFSTSLYRHESSRRTWQEDRNGGSVGLSKRFQVRDSRTSVGLRYTIKDIFIHNIDEATAPAAVTAIEGDNLISSAALDFTWNTRDNNRFPSRGWYVRAGAESAGGPFGGDHDFYKTSFDGRFYVPLYRTKPKSRRLPSYYTVLELRARPAWISPYGRNEDEGVPIFERYFAGGIGTLRGFDYRSVGPQDSDDNAIGGNFRLLGSAELTFPLQGNDFRGALFFDVGNVWEDYDDFAFDSAELKQSYGFGLHMMTPISPYPIEIYWSSIVDRQEGDRSQRVQFTFGFPF